MGLKAEDIAVDAMAPQAAIYLTVCFDLAGRKTPHPARTCSNLDDVTSYILDVRRAGHLVPFS